MVLDHAVRLEDVGADLVAPGVITQALLLGLFLGFPLPHRPVVETGPQDLHGAVPVAVLGPFVLTGDHDPRRQVRDAHCRVGHVDVLTAFAARPERVDAEVVFVDLDLDPVIQIRKGRHRSERGVAAMLGVKRGHPHQPVDSRFHPQAAVGVVALDLERRSLDSRLLGGLAVEELDGEPPAPGPADIHPEQHLRPVLSVGPSGARIDGHDRVFGVVFAGKQPPEFELVELAFKAVEVLAEVVGDVFALAGPLGEGLDLVERPLEGRAPLQFGKHGGPPPGERLPVARRRPDAGIAQLFVEGAELARQGSAVKETPGPPRRGRQEPGSGRAVPGS